MNKDLPIYLRIGSSKEASDSYLLKSEETEEYTNPMYFDTEGYNSIRSPWKVDPKTKETAYPKGEVIFEVYADSRPPKTSIDFAAERQVKSNNKILAGDEVRLTLDSYDAISGVENIYYSINKSEYKIYTDTLHFKEEKEYLVKYYSVDNVGNVEEAREITIQPDFSEPQTQLNVDGDLYNDIISARSEIILEASDNISGVKYTYYTIDGGKKNLYKYTLKGKYLSEGEHSITYYSVDEVGNEEEKKTYSFYVDKSAPTVVDELTGNTFVADGREYYSGRNKLKLVSMDNKAGVKEIRYSINNSEFKLYNKPFYLKKSGDLKIEVLAIDNVNNRKRTEKLSGGNNISYVDLSGPELGYAFEGPSFQSKDTVFVSKETRIMLKGNDKESGFRKIEYRISEKGETKEYNEPFSIEEGGEYSIRYTGYDNLDNTNSKTLLCVVDNQGPEIYHRFSMDPEKIRKIDGEEVPTYPSHVVLFLSSTDNFSGFDKMYYSLNDNSRQLYKSLIEGFQEETFYKLSVTAIDKLGNKQSREIKFYID